MCQYNAAIITQYSVAICVGANWYTFPSAVSPNSTSHNCTPVLRSHVADFEASFWKAVKLPGIFAENQLRGGLFHWTQAVWRKVQALGMSVAYNNDAEVHSFIRRIMALPFLPHEKIHQMFQQLQQEALGTTTYDVLLDYVEATWLRSSIWSVAEWSVFFQTTRTNNDVEGWHNRLNHSARHAQLNIYHLISLLHDEARLVNNQVKLVSEGRIKQDHRRRYANLQGRIFRYWGEFAAREGDSTSLLRACSRVNGPQM